MSTKLVTAIFRNVGGFPIYGHKEDSRTHRYLHSLAQIAQTGETIIVYLEEEYMSYYYDFWKQYGKDKGHYDIENYNNIIFKYITLEDFKHQKKMLELKTNYPDNEDFKMFHEIDWFKLQLLEKEIDEDHDYFYWIDSGLSHNGLFPLKAHKNSELLEIYNTYSINFIMYNFSKVFNPNLFPKINDYCKDKLLGICTSLCFWNIHPLKNLLIEKNYFKENDGYIHLSNKHNIGGIIGGNKKYINNFFKEWNNISQLCLDNKIIPNHEVILSSIKYHYPEWFKEFLFNTWYHDTSYYTMGALSDDKEWQKNAEQVKELVKSQKQFFHFFEEIGLKF